MPQNDAAVAQAGRDFVAALEVLEEEGGTDAGLLVNQRRLDLVAAVRAEVTT